MKRPGTGGVLDVVLPGGQMACLGGTEGLEKTMIQMAQFKCGSVSIFCLSFLLYRGIQRE